jgi:ribosomal protein S25
MLKDLTKEYEKRKSVVVTPQEIAARNDIRVSAAKQLLTELEEKNILKKAFSNRRLTVYVKA